MLIEIPYFDGCPNHETLLERLPSLLRQEGLYDHVALRNIASAAGAEEQCFLGSPMLRVNGVEVEPGAAEREDYGLKCRLYAAEGRLRGAVPDALIRAALSKR